MNWRNSRFWKTYSLNQRVKKRHHQKVSALKSSLFSDQMIRQSRDTTGCSFWSTQAVIITVLSFNLKPPLFLVDLILLRPWDFHHPLSYRSHMVIMMTWPARKTLQKKRKTWKHFCLFCVSLFTQLLQNTQRTRIKQSLSKTIHKKILVLTKTGIILASIYYISTTVCIWILKFDKVRARNHAGLK